MSDPAGVPREDGWSFKLSLDERLRLPCGICGQLRSRHVGKAHACFGGYGTLWDPEGEPDPRLIKPNEQRKPEPAASLGNPAWRVGGKVPLNVYENDVPMFQCHTPEQAARIVSLLNAGMPNAKRLDTAPAPEPLKLKYVCICGHLRTEHTDRGGCVSCNCCSYTPPLIHPPDAAKQPTPSQWRDDVRKLVEAARPFLVRQGQVLVLAEALKPFDAAPPDLERS